MSYSCFENHRVIKKGFFHRPSDRKKVQRYYCHTCQKGFSSQTWALDYRFRKRRINQAIFRSLCKGVSQRGCALLFSVKSATIARRVVRFGYVSSRNLAHYRRHRPPCRKVLFDEMESFEHTKCKPLTIPIAVEEGSRKILAFEVGQIAAKGPLAEISRKKYGPRRCERAKVLNRMLKDLKPLLVSGAQIKTDASHHYPGRVKRYFPHATHQAYKGRRGCVVGQGELKRGGWDPLFSLNHTYAMIRDNIKRLTRRTWCTTKKRERLKDFLSMYAWFHNLLMSREKRPSLKVEGMSGCN